MTSKRAHKAKKRAKRDTRRQTRRLQRTSSADPLAPTTHEDDPHIGFIAEDSFDLLRIDGDCVVAASRHEMQRTAAILSPGGKVKIRSVSFSKLYDFMHDSGQVCRFDEEAYARFAQCADQRGLELPE